MSKFWANRSTDDSSYSSSSDLEESPTTHHDNNDEKQQVDEDELLSTVPSSLESLNLGPSTTEPAADDSDGVWNAIRTTQAFLDPPRYKPNDKAGSPSVRIVCMSDTHGLHRDIAVPEGDILIHAGDFTMTGEEGTIHGLSDYFGSLSSSFQTILCIAGNHELTLQPEHYGKVHDVYHHKNPFDPMKCRNALQNCIYLEDESTVLRNHGDPDIHVYGSPWINDLCEWAFALPRLDYDHSLEAKRAAIPTSTDILITHMPPLGRGDQLDDGRRVGCIPLLQHVQHRIRPRLHVFGHVHEGYGCTFDGQTLFVNASNLNLQYRPTNPCIVVDLPLDPAQPASIIEPICRLETVEQAVGWFQANASDELAKAVFDRAREGREQFPTGQEWIPSDEGAAFQRVSEVLGLHRQRPELRRELLRLMFQIHAESFE